MTQKPPKKQPLGSGIKFVLPPDPSRSVEPTPVSPTAAVAAQPAPRGVSGVGAISRLIEGARTGPSQAIALIDPTNVELTEWADRHEASFGSSEFEELKESIRLAGGNIQPIKVRVSSAKGEGSQVRYQLVFGSRRLRACRELGLKVKAVVETVDGDRGLYLQMIGENRGRMGLSPWEQGMSYHRALSKGLFKNQAELVASSGLDQSNVSKAMRIAELPPEIMSLFASPTFLTFKAGLALTDALKARREAVMACASAMRGRAPPEPANVVKELLSTRPKAHPKQSRKSFALSGPRAGKVDVAADGSLRVQLPKGTIHADKLSAFMEGLQKLIGGL
jgi:ParB family transcriptional regulator, chromosome partitioning protein